eukprot:CAMPEP_0172567610 /NCGR_PEP_ID=MMETSP1067-20121228/116537_1 /TAXON_ID=265564 ORGANISM="Thalassiosira punctigera, Strain Tpunct2005C2" /NCGR_SAMPLE_ID=MMETSP1067 /ASSEMBLY_ACC=CAM_ASM_000444 /LENGTH=59 /DNA_ID=CAMNT_0013359001 /DNA_START=19 /DNA_END=194 /DNA_ORIENTATION=-
MKPSSISSSFSWEYPCFTSQAEEEAGKAKEGLLPLASLFSLFDSMGAVDIVSFARIFNS